MMTLTKHVSGQKKTKKIEGSLEIAIANAQNIAQIMEVPVPFQAL
jgi:hypothetical protein